MWGDPFPAPEPHFEHPHQALQEALRGMRVPIQGDGHTVPHQTPSSQAQAEASLGGSTCLVKIGQGVSLRANSWTQVGTQART